MERAIAKAALCRYNKEPFHLLHAVTLEAVMRRYAERIGLSAEADFWAIAGLLHDIDYEMYPDEHCQKAPELLKEIGASEALIHAVCSHAYGVCSSVEPNCEMERFLFAADELTGLIGAAAKMRPSGSVKDMELSSLKKKFKDKRFAAGCSRETIAEGARLLGWELDTLLGTVLSIMKEAEDEIKEAAMAMEEA